MKFNILTVLAVLSFSLPVTSQNTSSVMPRHGCGTKAPSPEWDAWFNQKVIEYKDQQPAGKAENISITIPVVVHVIHPGSAVNVYPNISSNQIRSQIKVLNEDFAGLGYNSQLLANTGFSAVGAANTHITFCLAQFDPNGNPMPDPGIDRINYNAKGWPGPTSATTSAAFQTLMDGTIKPGSIWDPTSYFNIWISDVHANTLLLGYATFPAGAGLTGISGNFGHAGSDGIWVKAKAFGNVGTPGTLQNPNHLGRTAVHETGHWLGLRHIGGDGNGNLSGDCSASDFCGDTPPQKGGNMSGEYGQNFGAPNYPLHAFVCGSPFGDMFMNFMDYTEDASCYMFTPDQNIRMQTALQNGTFRNTLSASSATQCLGLPYADFIQDTIGCINSGIAPVNATDEGSSVSTYSWSVYPAEDIAFSPSATSTNPVINFPQIGSYTVTMVVTNSIGVTTHTTALRLEDCTGLKESSLFESTVVLFPNPASGELNIRAGSHAGKELRISVSNTFGQVLVSELRDGAASTVQLDLSAFPGGIYTVTIRSGEEKVTKKLVLNK